MKNHMINRRQVIKGVAGLLFSTALPWIPVRGNSSDRESGGGINVIVGTIVQRYSPASLVIHTLEGQDIQIVIGTGTFVSRGDSGSGVGIEIFVPGDEVYAAGVWQNNVVVATELMTMYRFLEGSIIERHGNRIDTTGGTVYLTSRTMLVHEPGFIDKTLSEIGPGDKIVVDYWIAPDMFRVARIGVLETLP